VVNDGSRDKTAEIVREYAKKSQNVRLIENPGNHGKGYSVRHGMMEALGDIRLLSDADFSSPIEEANKLFAAIAAGADVAIGSRWKQRESLRTLGLRRIRHSVVRDDNPQTRGLIAVVSHLVEVKPAETGTGGKTK